MIEDHFGDKEKETKSKNKNQPQKDENDIEWEELAMLSEQILHNIDRNKVQ